MRNMGDLGSLTSKMLGELDWTSEQVPEGIVKKAMGKVEAIIDSTMPRERVNPVLFKASRKRRIVAGADTSVQEVNKLLRQFEQSQQIVKMFSGSGMAKLMRMVKGIKGVKGMFPGL